MLTLSSADIRALLPMKTAIRLVAQAMITTSGGGATLPLRHAMPLDAPNMLGIMPGALAEPPCYGTKLISLYPENPAQGYSSHLGLMVLFERAHGTPSAIMNAGILTALRTAAASAVATDVLARKEASVLAIIGTGEQAEHHIAAIREVRDIRRIVVAGRSPQRAQLFIDRMAETMAGVAFTAAPNAQDAVRDADIICTVTSAKEIVLRAGWVPAGCHVNAVGASVPSLQEIDSALVKQAALFVDYRTSALAQARDIIEPIAAGEISESHILAEIGEVLGGTAQGRTSDVQITLYRSLGIAAQDLACAHYVLEKARETGRGVAVSIE